MRIGLTYDLRDIYLAEGLSAVETAEFDRADTVAAIETELRAWGHDTDRIGRLPDLMARLLAGDRWDLVFNLAEGLRGIGREAQVPALLDAYGIPYTFSDPLVMALCLDKAMTKRVVRGLGIPTPDFAVLENLADISGLELPYPLFVKPLAEGTGKGIVAGSRVSNSDELTRGCARLWADFHQPVLVETYLSGREFTVGVLGSGRSARCLGVMEIVFNDRAEPTGYTFANKENYQHRVVYRSATDPAAEQAAEIALKVHVGLGCRDSSRVDLRVDARGQTQFMEINPLAGLHPVHSDLPILCRLNGIGYHQLIGEILASALTRIHRFESSSAPESAAVFAIKPPGSRAGAA